MPSFCLCPATLLPSPVTTVLAVSLCSCRDILYVYKQICVCVYSPSPLFYTSGTTYTLDIHCPAPYFLKLPIGLGDFPIFIQKELSFVCFLKTVFSIVCTAVYSTSLLVADIEVFLGFCYYTTQPVSSLRALSSAGGVSFIR